MTTRRNDDGKQIDGSRRRPAETHPEIRRAVVGERIAPMASGAGVALTLDTTFAEALASAASPR
ncbi:MAG: hypothetical protein OJF49_004243 [Ktedonobacterales bacterium]|nr:MAG: hypothetical protein OJF49_004243 [Ktedonobacterales bacterium]